MNQSRIEFPRDCWTDSAIPQILHDVVLVSRLVVSIGNAKEIRDRVDCSPFEDDRELRGILNRDLAKY
jgi:hypothetical protein